MRTLVESTTHFRRRIPALRGAFGIALAVFVILSPPMARAEERLVVAGIDLDGNFSYSFKGEEPLIDVRVNKPSLPENVTIRNNTGQDVVVKQYNGTDAVRLISKRSATIKNGKSISWPFQVFSLKVYNTGLLGKHLATGVKIESDVVLRKRNGKVEIMKVAVPNFTVNNKTSDKLTVKIYNEGDGIRLIARKSFDIEPGKSITWTDSPLAKFRVRIHRSKFLGKVLSEARNVNARTSIDVEEREWSRWKKLSGSRWVNGKRSDTGRPKEVATLDGLTSALDGYTFGNGQNWPLLFGLGAGNSVLELLLPDGVVGDGLATVHNSADWELVDQYGDEVTFFPGEVASAPSVVGDGQSVQTGKDKVLFARSPNGTLITKRLYKGSELNRSGSWTDLGGNLDSRPSAVSYGGGRPSRIMVVIRDVTTNGVRAISRSTSVKWSGWTNLGGTIQGSPFITASHHGQGSVSGLSNRVDVFARGADNTLRHRPWLEGDGWKSWETVPGEIASDPVVYAESDPNPWPKKTTVKTRFHVFALGPNGDIKRITFNGSKWGKWVSMGGKFASAPVVFFSDDES